jgi:serine protease Do
MTRTLTTLEFAAEAARAPAAGTSTRWCFLQPLRLLIVLLALLCSAAIVSAAPVSATVERPGSTPEEKAAALARPAVVFIETHWSGYVFDEEGLLFNDAEPMEFVSRCTGFVVGSAGYIATAGHCVDPAIEYGNGEDFLWAAVGESIENEYYVSSDPDELFAFGAANWRIEGATAGSPADLEIYVQRGVATGGRTDGEAFPARVVDFRPLAEGDVALLKIEKADLPSIELAPEGTAPIGTPVLSIGYPGSTDQVTDVTFEPTNKDGKINAQKTVNTVSFLEMSAALSGGMSGGPTVDLQGRVIGINSFAPTQEDEAFNYITPASHLAEMLSRNGVEHGLGSADATYRQGLDAYWAGRYTEAIGSFDKVLGVVPMHQQAQEYRQRAAKDLETFGDAVVAEEDGGGTAPAALIAGGLAIAVGIGAGAFVRTRRRGLRPAPAATDVQPDVWSPNPTAAPDPASTTIRMPDVVPQQQAPAVELLEPMPAGASRAAVTAPARRGRVNSSSAPAAENVRFCAGCGAPRGVSAFCPSCGSPLG